MIKATSSKELDKLLDEDAYKILDPIVDKLGFKVSELNTLGIEELKKKLEEVDKLLSKPGELGAIGKADYERDMHYVLPSHIEPKTVGYGITPFQNLVNRKKVILDLIKNKSRNYKINSLEDLIDNISDSALRSKIEKELKDFNKETNEIEAQEKKLSQEEKEFTNSQKLLEISKTKLELLEKKSQIWLNILAKESVASIVGALLLIVLSICLIVAMFMGINTSEIIESSFLLILGYFFGHSVSKK